MAPEAHMKLAARRIHVLNTNSTHQEHIAHGTLSAYKLGRLGRGLLWRQSNSRRTVGENTRIDQPAIASGRLTVFWREARSRAVLG